MSMQIGTSVYTLRCTTQRYTTLHCTTLHYTLHYTTLHYSTLLYTTLLYTTLHYSTVHYTTLHYIDSPYIKPPHLTRALVVSEARQNIGLFSVTVHHTVRKYNIRLGIRIKSETIIIFVDKGYQHVLLLILVLQGAIVMRTHDGPKNRIYPCFDTPY